TGTPDCITTFNTAQSLWNTAQPWSCVAVNQGSTPNEIAHGLNVRIFGDQNPPNFAPQCASVPPLGHNGYNNWAMFNPTYVPTGTNDPTYGVIRGQDGFPPGDPRVLDAFLTTYGAFSHFNGQGAIPIIGFGHFYVTGYIGQGGGFSPPTNCGMEGVPNNDVGVIVGH